MPSVCRAMLRASLTWMLTGFSVAGVLLLNKALGFFAPIWSLRPSHVSMLLLGWIVQLGMGMMTWIMPRDVATGDRGNLRLVWISYGTLNTGVLLAALDGPLAAALGGASVSPIAPLAGVLLLTSVVVFVMHIWRRVRPVVPSMG